MPQTPEIRARLATIDPAGPPSGCTAIIRNATLAEREATIVAAGDHFFNGDAKGDPVGDYMAGPVRVELAANAAAPFRSSDPRRLVTSLVAAVRVRFGDKDSKMAKEYDYTLEH